MPNKSDVKADHQQNAPHRPPHAVVHHSHAPHRPARIKTTRINWEALRGMYVRGIPPRDENQSQAREWPSLSVVARGFGASLGRVEVVSARENWPEQRESFRQQLRVEEDRAILNQLASKHVRARVACFMSAMRGLGLIDRLIQNEDLTPVEINRLMLALRNSQEVVERAVHGLI